jgi:PST family polysaccharide transporter
MTATASTRETALDPDSGAAAAVDEIDGTAPSGQPALSHLVRKGLQWSFAGAVIVRMGTFVSGLVMARLLIPSDFGVYSVGATALMITASINDIGIEPTLVRWPGDFDEVAPTAMTVVMACSVAIFLAFWLTAPAFALAFKAPDAAGIVRLMSVGLLISGAFTVHSALTTRTFRQHVRTWAEGAGMAVTIILTIVLAVVGLGPYSLAWGHIVGNMAVGAVLFIWSPVRQRPRFHWATARTLLRHGIPLAGAGLLGVAMLNVDYLTVGALLGAAPLGLYMLAWNMANWPVTFVSGSVNKVSVAGFAQLQTDRVRLNEAFSRSIGLVTAVTVPCCVLLGVLSLPAVRTVYGDKWAASSAPLVFLAGMAAIRVAVLLSSDVLVAGGWGRTIFGLQGLWLVALVPALVLAAHIGGIQGVGVGQLVVAAMMIPVYAWGLRRSGIELRSVSRALKLPLIGGTAIAVIGFAVMRLGVPDLAHLAIAGLLGLAAYSVVIRSMWVPELTKRWRHRRSSRADPIADCGSKEGARAALDRQTLPTRQPGLRLHCDATEAPPHDGGIPQQGQGQRAWT